MSHLNSNDPKLEWMYKDSRDLINRDDYLLGRTVDKNYEILDAEEQKEKDSRLLGITVPKNHVEYECIPFSIREYRSLQSTDQVDIQRKILEDPLMAIKQKEIESRRKLLENPVKLKELHNILKMEKLKKSSKKKKNKSRKKKNKKKIHSSSGSDSSGSDSEKDLDKILAKKYKKVKSSLDEDELNSNLDFDKILNKKFDKLSKELDYMTKSKHKKKKKKQRSSSSESSSSSSNSESDEISKKISNRSKNFEPGDVRRNFITRHLNMNSRRKPYSRPSLQNEKYSHHTNRRSNSQNRRNFDYRNRRSNSRNNEKYSYTQDTHLSRLRNKEDYNNRNKKSYSRDKEEHLNSRQDFRKYSYRDNTRRSHSGNETSRKRDKRSNSINKEYSGRIRQKDSNKNSYHEDKQGNKKETKDTNPGKLTEEEKERMRQQMMQQGAERDEARTNKVREYRKNVEIEENNQKSSFDHNFASKEIKKAYTASKSIESRIKSNLNNIQRTSRAMDSNFAKK